MAKPRMTIGDRKRKGKLPRRVIARWWDYKNAVQILAAAQNVVIGGELSVNFLIEMPKSWSKKKKLEMFLKPHTQRPDLDNLIKGFQDCLLPEDSHIWRIKDTIKVWAYKGYIEIP